MTTIPQAVVKSPPGSMSKDMQDKAIDTARALMKDTEKDEKDIASALRKEFDTTYGPTWHCFVGRNFGSYVTHETNHFIYFYVGQLGFLLFRSG